MDRRLFWMVGIAFLGSAAAACSQDDASSDADEMLGANRAGAATDARSAGAADRDKPGEAGDIVAVASAAG
jgi:hypothetical protein